MKKLIFIILPLLILPIIFQTTFTEVIKLRTFDAFVKKYNESGFFTILNITEEDLASEGGYPLPRQRLAEIHIELLEKGALGIGWVLAFPQPDRLGGDEAFAKTLCLYGSVLAMFEDGSGNYPKTSGTVILGNDKVKGIETSGVVENIDILKDCSFQGIAIAPTEVDNLVRRIPLMLQTPDGFVSAYGTEVMKVLAGNSTYIIKSNDNGFEEITVQGLEPVKTDNLGRKWISWVKTKETDLKNMDVSGRFVFVGFTASGIMPQVATPVGLLEPHKIQTALAESILIPDSPSIPDWSLAVEIAIFTLFVALSWLVLTSFSFTWGLGLGTFLMLSVASGGYTLIQKGFLIDVSWTLISQFITSSIAFYLRFREQYKLRQQIKKQFEHYLDPRQVAELQKNPELLQLGGEKKYCTFLFTDVRGFTALSETLEPEQVTYIMNKALTVQQKAVQQNGGMVDKYIGDAMMAIFNAPLDLEHHETKALACAIDIKNNMKKLNKELKKEGIAPVQIGIGINSGFATIGNCGSENRFDYTAIGDAVNVAARLESGTKDAGVDLLIGETTENAIEFDLIPLKPIKAKGKKEKLQVYTWD